MFVSPCVRREDLVGDLEETGGDVCAGDGVEGWSLRVS